MTPLAQAIANDSCLPAKKRRFGDWAQEIGLFDDLHFFECSAVFEAAVAISTKLIQSENPNSRQTTFLPAPRTWIEYSTRGLIDRPFRAALLLEQEGEFAIISKLVLGEGLVYLPRFAKLPMYGSELPVNHVYRNANKPDYMTDEKWQANIDVACQETIGFLAMINTPKIIGQRKHNPHAGLQRKLAASRGMPGRYPLRAWTEIKLEVTPPHESSDGDHETRLTGGRAMHFCRCYLRVRMGRLELVSSHWRGDPALGIKQNRYSVIPPKSGIWPKWAA